MDDLVSVVVESHREDRYAPESVTLIAPCPCGDDNVSVVVRRGDDWPTVIRAKAPCGFTWTAQSLADLDQEQGASPAYWWNLVRDDIASAYQKTHLRVFGWVC